MSQNRFEIQISYRKTILYTQVEKIDTFKDMTVILLIFYDIHI